jgi:hypothetical protein
VSQSTGTGGRHGYATALADLWYALSQTLRRLDELAAGPVEDTGGELPSLQYALHVAGERIAGLEPPAGAQDAHEELQAAIADARDATAEVAESFAEGGLAAVRPLVWEWRGSLFRVRMARQRLLQSGPTAGPGRPTGRSRNDAVVAAVVALPVTAAAVIALAAGAAAWIVAAALGVAAAICIALRRA